MSDIRKIVNSVSDAKNAITFMGDCIKLAIPVLDKAARGEECKDEARTVLIQIYRMMEKFL